VSTTWFTSDTHFGHRLVAGYRGFGERVNAHDGVVLHSWIEHIGANDIVYVLGDISCGNTATENRALDLMEGLPGTKHLIAGNHDSVASIHRGGWRRREAFERVFVSVRDFARIKMRKQDVLLSHYPYLGPGADHPEEAIRYAQYRLMDIGLPLIHGHTHIADQRLHHSPLRTPQVHVGWDAWRRPVARHEVEALLFETDGDGS
jgi:calcineurin-like phosphoesterase family protein